MYYMSVECVSKDGTYQSSPNLHLLIRVHIQQMCGLLQAQEILISTIHFDISQIKGFWQYLLSKISELL